MGPCEGDESKGVEGPTWSVDAVLGRGTSQTVRSGRGNRAVFASVSQWTKGRPKAEKKRLRNITVTRHACPQLRLGIRRTRLCNKCYHVSGNQKGKRMPCIFDPEGIMYNYYS